MEKVLFSQFDTHGNHRVKTFFYDGKWYNRKEMEHMGLDDEAHWAVLRYYEADEVFEEAANR